MFTATLIFFTTLQSIHSISDKPILIVVSYDGFRYDYLNEGLTPNMLQLRQEGTYATYINNVFPTKTFPNHFTIATGMYTEVHGVVGNSFYDPALKKIVKIGEEMFTQNKEIIPIWTLNELAGEGRHSGTLMWPGSSFAYKKTTPTYTFEWNQEYDNFKRIDKVIEWLTDADKPANFVMVYIEQPDYYSHIYGPDSEPVLDQIRRLDKLTKYLDDELRKYKLKDRATVVHLSDHGMVGVKLKNIVNITQYLQSGTYTMADTSPCVHVIPKEGFEKSIYDSLKKASETLNVFDVYKKEDMPEHWHYKNNPRVPPIFLVARENYAFQDVAEVADQYKDKNNVTLTPETVFGVHGYDPTLMKMHPFFMVRGPNIRKNHLIRPFVTVDLYDFFAEILETKSIPNNGTIAIYKDIAIRSTFSGVSSVILIAVGGVVLSLLLIGCAAGITILVIKKQQSLRTTAALNKRFPQTFQQSIEAQHLLEAEDA